MSFDKPIRRIAIVGTGVIGGSWAAEYLARGFDVVATDPAPNAEANLRKYVDEAWPALTKLGLSAGASRDRLSFTTDMKAALAQADFVQENGPERVDFKIKLFAEMDDATPLDSIIASSSSGITPSVMQTECKHPERIVIGHPFNPPHIIPLVEVVGGTKTSPEAIQRAISFYAAIGKKPILLHKELPGHVGNRLQAALYKEVLYLIQQGVLSVSDADDAVSYGPGLRWGLMGPSLQWHVNGGAVGIKHFMEHLMPGMQAMFKVLGAPEVTDELKQMIVDGVLQIAGKRTVDELAQNENEELLALIKLREGNRNAAVKSTTTATNGRSENGERVFFLDVSGGRIESLNPDGSDRRVVLDGLKRIPDGIAVDAELRHVYWTNMGNPKANDGSIERADLDGSNRQTIVPPGATFTPKQMKLDKKGGKIYWSDREGMRIMRANLDGSQIETLVDTSEGDPSPGRDEKKWCVGIAVDHDGGQIYWTQKGSDNAGDGRILRASLEIPNGEDPANRSDIEVLFDNLPEPIDLDLDLDQREIYWTDRGDAPRGNTLSRASLDGDSKDASRQEILVTGLMEGIGLALDLKNGRMFFTDLGGSVYSAKLDGSDKKALTVAQGNLTGVAYAELVQAKAAGRNDGPRLIP
ncbi:MAG TPA: 3-hydroxyacyl-CoA dehydrogenase NAD-binding domain-containing protein [Pyrinomonadaceae bacterium]|nr:3-hydroxyacyl-CoA dehydrogenase NAD-binding domain-containing protein [Pyrinomonadaceae bacterium]